jgi:hypothetical protein
MEKEKGPSCYQEGPFSFSIGGFSGGWMSEI